jgi:ankyrin repeat protein
LLQVLIKRGAQLDVTDTESSQSLLQAAIASGHRQVVSLLLTEGKQRLGADDRTGAAALVLQAARGDLEFVKLLLNAGMVT